MKISEKQPEARDEFYEQLDSIVSQIANRDVVILLGDFNAKTGSGYKEFPDNMGNFGKGLLNSNGRKLLELCKQNDLVLLNTLFKHKAAHRTTWTAPEHIKEHLAHDGTPRRNPYRNQIDYIIARNCHRKLVTNARSYGGIETSSDHKLVKAHVNIECIKYIYRTPKEPNINLGEIHNEKTRKKYQETVMKIYKNHKDQEITPQQKWNLITNTCLEAGKKEFGIKEKVKHHEDDKLEELSTKQKALRMNIEAEKSTDKRKELKKERNKIQRNITKRISEIEEEKLNNQLKEIEEANDSQKCFQAIKAVTRKKPKKALIVQREDQSYASTEKEKLTIITNFFENMFAGEDLNIDIPPQKMKTPFNTEEIKKASKSMKNNRSPGPDKLNAEYIKYGPTEIQSEIAKLLNNIAETGDYPSEMKKGYLTPLNKPGKKKGPTINLRPIILLSILRKLLAICLIKRTWSKFSTLIDIDQAAYQEGRSTTEQVFAVKLLAEKAIASNSYEIYLLLLDMSKAFDTVHRTKLIKDLQDILPPDELHLMSILIKDVKLQVKINKTTGREFETKTGIAQGDCLSAVLFIFYLARSLNRKTSSEDHTYATSDNPVIPPELKDHNYYIPTRNFFEISPKYADDITWATTAKERIQQIKDQIPETLRERNLTINETKTEEYTISRKSDDTWKKCKLLGTLLDSENDIKRRKGLALDAYKTYQDIFNSKHISDKTKLRVFEVYIKSIFLYNCEIWTLTIKLTNTVDVFQRTLLRKILQIHWPRTISNEDLYEKTTAKPWSEIIKKRRLSWLGHLMRMNTETPARKALQEYLRKTKRPRGKPPLSWIELIRKDLQEIGLNINFKNQTEPLQQLQRLAKNRDTWRKQITCARRL
jgi:hypothetical protein